MKERKNRLTIFSLTSLTRGHNRNLTIALAITIATLLIYIAQLTGFSIYETTDYGITADISACQDITSSGTYTLTASITTNNTCFNINVSNVILDGSGYSITSNGTGTGVLAINYNNITIKNFAGITNFTAGINLTGTDLGDVYNNTVTTFDAQKTYGIVLGGYSTITNRTVVRSNTINTYGGGAAGNNVVGIKTYGTVRSNITFNSITANGNYTRGVDVDGALTNSENIRVTDNVISATKGGSDGIYASSAVATIAKNNVTLSGTFASSTSAGAIYLASSSNINVSSNIIVMVQPGGTAAGILINNADTSTFDYNSISTSGTSGDGFYITGGSPDDSNFTANNITTTGSGARGYEFNTGLRNMVTNNKISASGANDIYFTSGSANVTNSSFSKTDIAGNGPGNISVKWYVSTSVQNKSGSGIQNANATTYDINNLVLNSQITDSNGAITTQSITEFVKYQNSTNYSTPHNITAILTGYFTNSTVINLTTTNSTTVTISMATNTTPAITITTPQNNSYLSVTTLSIIGTASDQDLDNDTVSINTTAFGNNLGTYQNWNFTNTSISEGVYNVKITANDTYGNSNSSSLTFTIDRTYPGNISFNNPTLSAGAYNNKNYYEVNFTFTDVNPDTCLLEVSGANITMTRTGTS
ncbi:hypothetical protein HY483_00910, partial [Candidatus Woesearchaeota archaeon]|nr:hypothetical protein [Candidatus Woesearchaeota archaeon]